MKKIGQAYRYFAFHFALILLLFSLMRVLFYLFNISFFPQAELINFIGGIRFDWMTTTILYAPFLLLFPFVYHKSSKLLQFLFYFSTALAIVFSFIDFEYYKFTLKRTTADLFSTQGLANDFGNIVSSFLIDYWYLIFLALLLFYAIIKAYHKINRLQSEKLKAGPKSLFIFSLLVFYAIGFRGGLQYRPLNVIQASQYATAQNISLVLNTPFTLIKSSYKEDIKAKNYFSDEEIEQLYSPVQSFKADSSAKALNVVLIIAESFSKEYIGALNDYEGYTPFLDSLVEQSLVFTNAFANGKKSIESLPSILSSIPTLMNNSYISGKYAGNQIESIASVLKEKGYATSFYHGGENGTMGFQAFSQLAGIETYKGRNQYPNKGDYDGNWGIFDEPFLQYFSRELDQQQQPFFSTIFTLSSHHPYTIPEQHQGRFKGGPLPILESIEYADYSLEQFFKAIKDKDWFNETIFVITADHTSQSFHETYQSNMGIYRIPMIVYAPKYIEPKMEEKIIQQNDIFPSLLDFLGIESTIVSFGNSFFANAPSFSISYLNEIYQLVQEDYCLQFDGENSIALYNWKKDELLEDNLILNEEVTTKKYEEKIKAIIQQYNNRLLTNQLISK